MSRIVGAYSAGIILCLVYGIGIFRGVPLYVATTRAMIAAAVAYFVGRFAATCFLRVVAETIADSQEKAAQETTPDEEPATE